MSESDPGLPVDDMWVHDCPLHDPNFRFNAESEAAFQEAQDIIDGKIIAKSYASFDELLAEIDAEIAEEDAAKAGSMDMTRSIPYQDGAARPRRTSERIEEA